MESICVSWILYCNERYRLLQYLVVLMIQLTIMINIISAINYFFLQAKFTTELWSYVRNKICLDSLLCYTTKSSATDIWAAQFYTHSVSSRRSLPQWITTYINMGFRNSCHSWLKQYWGMEAAWNLLELL